MVMSDKDKGKLFSLAKQRKKKKETISERNRKVLDKYAPLGEDKEKAKKELMDQVEKKLGVIKDLANILLTQQHRRSQSVKVPLDRKDDE